MLFFWVLLLIVNKMTDGNETFSDRKSRSLSICPSTIITSKDWKEPQEHKKKARAKSIFIGKVNPRYKYSYL